MSQPDPRPRGSVDEQGRFRMHARLSAAVIGTYGIMIVLIGAIVAPRLGISYSWVTFLLLGLTVLFLLRYLSTHYVIDDEKLTASTLLGRRRIPLEEVRAIEYASLRELSATGGLFTSSLGRARMYSPTIGDFDAVFTDAAAGLLVTSGAFPLYISPRQPPEFARELSRRVRSYTGPLPKDVGFPGTNRS